MCSLVAVNEEEAPSGGVCKEQGMTPADFVFTYRATVSSETGLWGRQ